MPICIILLEFIHAADRVEDIKASTFVTVRGVFRVNSDGFQTHAKLGVVITFVERPNPGETFVGVG